MGNVLKKNYPSATCLNCGKVTDIQLSGDYRSLVAQNTTLKEALKFSQDTQRRIHIMKNSQLQTLHKTIKQMLDLMTDEQKERVKGISQFMREELKRAEREVFKR